jgi:hypothetical protein
VYDDVTRKVTVTQESRAGQLGVPGEGGEGERGKIQRSLFLGVLGGDTRIAPIVSGKPCDFRGLSKDRGLNRGHFALPVRKIVLAPRDRLGFAAALVLVSIKEEPGNAPGSLEKNKVY